MNVAKNDFQTTWGNALFLFRDGYTNYINAWNLTVDKQEGATAFIILEMPFSDDNHRLAMDIHAHSLALTSACARDRTRYDEADAVVRFEHCLFLGFSTLLIDRGPDSNEVVVAHYRYACNMIMVDKDEK